VNSAFGHLRKRGFLYYTVRPHLNSIVGYIRRSYVTDRAAISGYHAGTDVKSSKAYFIGIFIADNGRR
jgi:hypothetical protein